MEPNLRCHIDELPNLAHRYQEQNVDEDVELNRMRESVLARGCVIKDELRVVARWKSARSAGYIEKNSDEYVREITGFAFEAQTERARLELLTLLDGVQWAMASVILHFFHPEPYPIFDFRAAWTVGLDEADQWDFDFWWKYVSYCRRLAEETSLSMRHLDQALWQYSRENQMQS